ncbi:MAG: serine/threonine protein kinase [Sandaracinaceae bacterium]|nr:serine/threonine protein kinase [Sandaracinaceae bacterium]MBK8407474.1 serine/threonine protein kinase [Sandaracinaceae bacterium]MBP7684105.1 serine/threonine protein kinase [Deltaproteobacteria bacterium]
MRFCPACASRFSQDVRFCPTDGQPTQQLPDEKQENVDPLLGSVVDGRYRVDRVLGEGGMGVVYAAMHVTLGKRVALKVLRGEMARDDEVVKRFVQEAQASSSIGHANIIDITDFGRLPDGTSYFVMEYLEGQSLTQLIEQGGSMGGDEALGIIEQVASALSAAHGRGIIHRDLKPDNIFLVKRGHQNHFVKVLDFGIAKVGGANSKLTKTGMVFGTPYYMSPEQAAGQTIDARTDIYALGIIMYEMFTGQVPFDGDTFMGILSKHMFEAPVPPRERVAAAQLPAEPIILRCLAKRPEDRYPSMDALIGDLRSVDSIAPVAIGKSASQAPPRNVAGKIHTPAGRIRQAAATGATGSGAGTGRWVVLGIVMVLLLLGGVAGAAMALMQPRDEAAGAMAEVPRVTSVAAPDSAPHAPLPAAAATAVPTPVAAAAPGADEVVLEAPRSMILILTDPTGAMVEHDGALIGNTPLEFPRPDSSASTELAISLSGYEDARVSVSTHSPDRIEVSLSGDASRGRRGSASNTRPTATPSAATPAPVTPAPVPVPAAVRAPDVVDPWDR